MQIYYITLDPSKLFKGKPHCKLKNDPKNGHRTVKFMWKTRPYFGPKNSLI